MATFANGIISQSLKKNCEQKIISIAPIGNEDNERNRILEKLNDNISEERLILINKKAKEWLESVSCEEIESYLGANEEPF